MAAEESTISSLSAFAVTLTVSRGATAICENVAPAGFQHLVQPQTWLWAVCDATVHFDRIRAAQAPHYPAGEVCLARFHTLVHGRVNRYSHFLVLPFGSNGRSWFRIFFVGAREHECAPTEAAAQRIFPNSGVSLLNDSRPASGDIETSVNEARRRRAGLR